MGIKHYDKSFKERAVKLSYERSSVEVKSGKPAKVKPNATAQQETQTTEISQEQPSEQAA